jgi:hypothetical protein
LADLPSVVRSIGPTLDILFETPGSPYLFVQFADGVQLELSSGRASMVRRGSTVRVRQRACTKALQVGISCCLLVEHADTERTHLRFARRTAALRDVF